MPSCALNPDVTNVVESCIIDHTTIIHIVICNGPYSSSCFKRELDRKILYGRNDGKVIHPFLFSDLDYLFSPLSLL